jgi:hypothetical protein
MWLARRITRVSIIIIVNNTTNLSRSISVPIIPEFLYNIRHREDGLTYESYEAEFEQQQAMTTTKILSTPETLYVSDIPRNLSNAFHNFFRLGDALNFVSYDVPFPLRRFLHV